MMPAKDRQYTLILFQQDGQRYSIIDRPTVLAIQRKLDGVVETRPEQSVLDIWIDSPGGDAHATYKLLLDLRQRFKRIRAFIPDVAKSAGTLLMLGVDEIYMAAGADLGPLDVQISHPDKEDQTVSGLDVAQSLNYLSKFAIELALTGGATVIKYTELPRADVLDAMLRFTARFLEPCVSKLDPHLTRRAVYQLKVAERYALSMLATRVCPKLDQARANKMVRSLVNEYPVHEFVISRDEARGLGLPVFDAEEYPGWPTILEYHRRFVAGDRCIVEVVSNDPLAEKTEHSQRENTEVKRTRKKKTGASNAPSNQRRSSEDTTSSGKPGRDGRAVDESAGNSTTAKSSQVNGRDSTPSTGRGRRSIGAR